jgi:hypothetical protein
MSCKKRARKEQEKSKRRAREEQEKSKRREKKRKKRKERTRRSECELGAIFVTLLFAAFNGK